MTGFLDTELASAIKPTSKIKGKNIDLMAGTYSIRINTSTSGANPTTNAFAQGMHNKHVE